MDIKEGKCRNMLLKQILTVDEKRRCLAASRRPHTVVHRAAVISGVTNCSRHYHQGGATWRVLYLPVILIPPIFRLRVTQLYQIDESLNTEYIQLDYCTLPQVY